MSDFDLGLGNSGVSSGEDEESLVYDLNAVSEPSFDVLPKGTYNAVVDEFEFTTSQSSGAPMLKAVYSITDGEYAERKIYDYYVLTGEGAKYSMPKLKQLLARVCPEVDLGTFNPPKFAESAIIINRCCQLVLSITTQKKGEYKGEKRNQVREILAAASFGGSSFLG
jgi:hypothetical protein